MHIRPLPAEEDAVRRYAESLLLPFHRDLATAVDAHDVADEFDFVAEQTEFVLDRLESDEVRVWIAVAGDPGEYPVGRDEGLPADDGALLGFITTSVDECPSVFDRPDRLVVGDFFVREARRGTGLARELMEHAAARAREKGCPELALDVGVDNDRAIAFYEKVGFEPGRYRMWADVEDV